MRSPASPGMLAGGPSGAVSTVRAEDLRRTLSRYHSRTAAAGVSKELDFDNIPDITIDGKLLFECLERYVDKGLANTALTEIFDAASPLMASITEKLQADGTALADIIRFKATLQSVVPFIIPQMRIVQRKFLQVTSVASAPHIVKQLGLTHKPAEQFDVSPGAKTLIEALIKLAPTYTKLSALLTSIENDEKQRFEIQRAIDSAESELQLLDSSRPDGSIGFNPFDFLSAWSDDDSAKLITECKASAAASPQRDITGIDWDDVATKFGTHDAEECRNEFTRKMSEATIKKATVSLSNMDARLKSKLRQRDQIMVELSKFDAPTSNNTRSNTSRDPRHRLAGNFLKY
eukprot:SAG31_NODE_2223_length_6152_cov_4.129688_1_plen_347_part_00